MTTTPARLRKAVLPVAGLGTRVLPGTKTTPKELLNVVDRPILSYIVEEAREAGIEHIVFVTGRSKGAIEDYFDHQIELEAQLLAKGKTDILEMMNAELASAGEMSFTRQMQPKGLGHAVWCARDIIGHEPFAVILPDVIVDSQPGALKQLAEVYSETGGNIIGVESVPEDQTHKYGIVDPVSRDGSRIVMKGMVEKPKTKDAPSNLAVIGRSGGKHVGGFRYLLAFVEGLLNAANVASVLEGDGLVDRGTGDLCQQFELCVVHAIWGHPVQHIT